MPSILKYDEIRGEFWSCIIFWWYL